MIANLKNKGITMVELMVALVISSIMMLGIGNIYFSTKRGSQISDEFAKIQENGRFAMETLQQAIREAGNVGCGSGLIGPVDNTLNLNNGDSFIFDMNTGIVGFEFNNTEPGNATIVNLAQDPSVTGAANWWAPNGVNMAIQDDRQTSISLSYAIPANIAALIIPGSDILVTRSTTGSGVDVIENNDSAVIWVRDNGTVANGCTQNSPATDQISGLCINDILLLSDCTKSVVFQATNLTSTGGGPGNCSGINCLKINHAVGGTPGNRPPASWGGNNVDPNKRYGPGSEIMRVVTKIFFIGIPAGTSGTPQAIPTLFVSENGGTPQPLVEGVEVMQVLYGVDTDSTPDGVANHYVAADDVTDVDGTTETVFDGVVSVRLALVVRSINPLSGVNKPAEPQLNLISAANPIAIQPANDNRVRKTFDLTVELRNRATNVGP